MRFTQRSYTVWTPRTSGGQVLGDLILSHTDPLGAPTFVKGVLATDYAYYLRFAVYSGESLSPEAQFETVDLARSVATPALLENYLIGMRSDDSTFSVTERFVSDGLQKTTFLAGWGEVVPGDILEITSAPLLADVGGTPASVADLAPPPVYAVHDGA